MKRPLDLLAVVMNLSMAGGPLVRVLALLKLGNLDKDAHS